MDNMSGPDEMQFNRTEVQEFCTREVTMLCELVAFLRSWWEAFQDTIRKLDRAASVKAHDAMVDAVALARRISRELGVTLPDFSQYDWAATLPPAGRPAVEF